MAIVLAYERLFDAVTAEFTEKQLPVVNSFGWRTPAQQIVTGSRIDWVPGNHQTGDLGEYGGPKFPGRNPRAIGNLDELFTIFITGVSPGLPDNERAQWRATRLLFDEWFRCVYHAAHGTFKIVQSAWVISRKERRAVTTLRVLLALQAKLSDDAAEEVQGTTLGGEITMTAVENVAVDLGVPPHTTTDQPISIPVPTPVP